MTAQRGRSLVMGWLALVGACVVQSETVSGPKGDKGDPGASDAAAIAMLQDTISKLQSRVDALEQAGKPDPDCPAGYTKDASVKDFVLCKKGVDEIVKVGTGGSAFWIDRYEASVWQNADGTGDRYFKDSDNDHGVLNALPKSGQWSGAAIPAFALSAAGEMPSAYITWFQANTVCRVSGKRLPSGDEWLEAARGTPDPATGNPGLSNQLCNTQDSGVRITGAGVTCRSAWGTEDMVGNVLEMTAEWYATVKTNSDGEPVSPEYANWPEASGPYGHDHTFYVTSVASSMGDVQSRVPGLPAMGLRGGGYSDGTNAGVFLLNLAVAPSAWDNNVGFRCVLPR